VYAGGPEDGAGVYAGGPEDGAGVYAGGPEDGAGVYAGGPEAAAAGGPEDGGAEVGEAIDAAGGSFWLTGVKPGNEPGGPGTFGEPAGGPLGGVGPPPGGGGTGTLALPTWPEAGRGLGPGWP
jgi:hypothetical protein